MADGNLYYTALGHYQNGVEHGKSLLIKREIEYKSYITDPPELLPLLTLSQAELKVKRAECVIKENEVQDKLKALELEWEVRAAQTLLVDKAMEYVRTPEVEHTNNEWVRRKDGTWQISNRVYRMAYRIKEDRTNNAPWLCEWGIKINPPQRPETEKYSSTGSDDVVEIKKKRFNGEADAQNYIQGRFNAYAHLFREITPPIPYQFRRHFMINGCLLPDYTVLPQEKTQPDRETVDALLDALEDEDLTPPQKTATSTTVDKDKRLVVTAKPPRASAKKNTKSAQVR